MPREGPNAISRLRADKLSDDNQSVVPRSFIALFLTPGVHKTREPRAVVAARDE